MAPHWITGVGGSSGVVILQEITDIADGLERSAQIVGNCVREGFEFSIGCEELRSPLFYADLQLVSCLLECHIASLYLGQLRLTTRQSRSNSLLGGVGMRCRRF